MPRACAMMSPIGQSLSSRRYSTAKSASTKCVIGSTGSPDRIDDRTPNRCCGLVSPRSANLGLGVSNLDVVWQLCRSEEHTSELQSLMRISYAVFCLKKKNITHTKLTLYTIHNAVEYPLYDNTYQHRL